MVRYLIFLLLFLTFAFSCKKYPEDPGRPFSTATTRLIKFGWRLKEYNVDGVDSSHHAYTIQGLTIYSLYDSFVKFNKSGSLLFNEKTVQAEALGYRFNIGDWKFNEHKKELSFDPSSETLTYFPVQHGIWTIKKLTHDELIIETTDIHSKNIRVKFTRV